ARFLSANGADNGAGIAGEFAPLGVLDGAGLLVDSDDGSAVRLGLAQVGGPRPLLAAADGDDHEIAIDDRGAADTEEILMEVVLRPGVELPQFFPVGDGKAVQHSFRTVRVDAIAVDGGAGAWARIVAVIISIVGGIIELPQEFAGGGRSAGEPAIVVEAVEVEEFAAGDDGRGIAGAERAIPYLGEAGLRPRSNDSLFGGNIVVIGAE